MTRIAFAVAVAGLVTMAVSAPSQAAPIAPPAGVTSIDQTFGNAGALVAPSPSPLLARPLGPRALPLVVIGC